MNLVFTALAAICHALFWLACLLTGAIVLIVLYLIRILER